MRFVRWCINNPVSINLLVAFLILAGFYSLMHIQREIFPPFSLDRVLVTVVFPGANPDEIEEGICIKIEEALTGLSGIKNISSTSRESIGTVVIEIETGEDIDQMTNDIETRINGINTFPRDAEKPVVKKLEMIRQVLHLVISGDLSEETLRNLAEEVKKNLLAFSEISQVTVNGLKDFEISIELSESRMREFNLTFDDVAKAIRANSLDLSAGIVRSSGREILLRVKAQKYVRTDFEDLVIRTNHEGSTIFLHQIAKIRDSFADTKLEGKLNGKRAALVSVFKTESEDIIRISDKVHQYAEEKKKNLPGDVQFTILADTSVAVKSRLDLLKRNGLQGLIAVFLCLWIFLNINLSFWVSFGIPISMLGTFILLNYLDQSLNMLSMFGLVMALGMIVDDAIVISESVYSYMENDPSMRPPEAALKGTLRVLWPILASITTTIVAFLPLNFMSGIMGKFIAILPITVISCLLVSLVEAMIGLPCHLAHHLPRPQPESEMNPIRRRLEKKISQIIQGYTKILEISIDYRYATLGLAIFILFLSVGMVGAGWIHFVIFPRGDSDSVNARILFPEGVSFETTNEAIKTLNKSLDIVRIAIKDKSKTDKDVIQNVYAISGQHTGQDSTYGSNLGEVQVELLPSEERKISSAELLNLWRAHTPPIPGVRSLIFSEQERGPGGKRIEIQLRGDDFSVLQQASMELQNQLRTFPGVIDVQDDFKSGLTEIRLSLKPYGRHLGFNLNDLALQVRHGFFGNEALRLQRGRFDVKVFLRFPERDRKSLATLENMIIRTPNGTAVPLMEVAEFSNNTGTSLIKRMEGYRLISVNSDIDETKANSNQIIGTLVSSGFLDNLAKKYRIGYSFEGQQKETIESVQGLLRGFLFSFIGIFIILATIFSSYLQPLIIMTAIPFGIIGALFGHLLMGYPITMLSLFGLVALSGIVVNNSLLIIDFINIGLKEGSSAREAAIKAGQQRFRPILLTSMTTILGVSSIMLEKSFQAQFLIPMAISLAWGLLFSTCITLFLVPSLFLIEVDFLGLIHWLWEGKWVDDKELAGGDNLAIPED